MDAEGINYLEMFGNRLKYERELQGMTLQYLATVTDIDLVTLIRMEDGSIDFPAEYVIDLLQALKVTAAVFFEGFD
jgi:transcriptional regulator with XRE-family HTH domain